MLYSDLVTALGTVMVIPITTPTSATPSSNTDFNNFLPRILEAAEQRIYRELDFLACRQEDLTTTLSTATRKNTLPATNIVLQSANVITPAGALPTDLNAKRVGLEIVAKDFIDQIWPQESVGKDVPKYIAQLSATQVIVAPTADQAYKLETTGIFRPNPISASNTSTYTSVTYPDLLLFACLVVACGYQRDFGQQSDDPKMAVTWESMYQTAKTSTLDEEQRRKSQSTNWSPYSATPLSSPRK